MGCEKGPSSSFYSICAGVLVISSCLSWQVCAETNPKDARRMGHMKPLGSHTPDLCPLLPVMQCGGFQKSVSRSTMWLGSGKTSSVLHYDGMDNILCVMDGQKDLILINRTYQGDVEADGFIETNGYSTVDVDKVDMDKFPRLGNVKWRQAKLSKGDCIFIPDGWYHQVRSTGDRHLGINYFFTHLFWFDDSDCLSNHDKLTDQLQPLLDHNVAAPNEIYRSVLLAELQEIDMLAPTKEAFCSSYEKSTKELREKFFDAIDKDKDSVLSGPELYGFNIDKAVEYFQDMFDELDKVEDPPDIPDDLVLYEPDEGDVSDEEEQHVIDEL